MTTRYKINVARVIPENIGKPFGPYHAHYCNIDLPEGMTEDEARARASVIAGLFYDDAATFKLELTAWSSSGHVVAF